MEKGERRRERRARGEGINMKKLTLWTVLEATNVVAVDLGGKSDPYCILQVDGEKKTTRSRKYVRFCFYSSSSSFFKYYHFIFCCTLLEKN